MIKTIETDALLKQCKIKGRNPDPWKLCRKLERERNEARRELDIQLESIKFHMERVPVREHPLRADDAKLWGEEAQ